MRYEQNCRGRKCRNRKWREKNSSSDAMFSSISDFPVAAFGSLSAGSFPLMPMPVWLIAVICRSCASVRPSLTPPRGGVIDND